jgi:hypothetical protein
VTLGALGGAVKPLTRAEILALPPAIGLPDLGRALGVSAPVIRERHRSGELERLGVRIVKLGAQYRVVTSTVWAFLGIGPDDAAGGAGIESRPRRPARQGRPTGSALRSVRAGLAGGDDAA